MAINLQSVSRNTTLQPPRIMIYSVHGIGKTTFAAGSPAPIFILTEDGLGKLEVDHFPLATKLSDVHDALAALKGEHDFQTVVIDSLDWLDNLIWQDINAKYDEKALGFGKGAVIAADYWRKILDGINDLRARGMASILLAHSEIKRFDSPEVDPFERYQPKLQGRSSALLQEFCDVVGFANYKTTVKTAEEDYQAQLGRVKTLDAELNDYKVWANGNGTLRDGRKIDKGALAAYQELQEQHRLAVEKLSKIEQTGLPPEFDTSKFVTREDIQKQLGDRDARYAGVIKQMGRLASKHAVDFKEALDVDALEKLAIETNLPLDVAYERMIGPRMEEARKTAAEAEMDKARQEYKAAQEAFDTDAIIAAQEKLFEAKIKLQNAQNFRPPALQEEKFDVQPRLTDDFFSANRGIIGLLFRMKWLSTDSIWF